MTEEIEKSLRVWATVHTKPDLGNEMAQARQVLVLLDELARLRRWKAEALPLLTEYDAIARTVPGVLGSSIVANLRDELARMRKVINDYDRELCEELNK